MATLFVRHDVADFDTWKKAYDAFDDERQSLGVIGQGVYRAEDNPNDITVYHHFKSMDAAKAFMQSDQLREVMQQAGVTGDPKVWFTIPA
jgi:quinol monooxygenase YgiN